MDSSRVDKEPQSSTAPFRQLLDLPRDQATALLFSGGPGPTWLCSEPIDSLCLAPDAWVGAFDALAEFVAVHRDRRCVGFLGYDLRDDVEALRRTAADDFSSPCLHFTAFRSVECIGSTPPISSNATIPSSAAGIAPPDIDVPLARNLRAHSTRADFEARIQRVVDHIRVGDIFQANLTQPFSADFDGDPRALFWKLCHASPAPFAAYYETGTGEAVLCSSPEEFLAVDGDRVRARPIKGTRPRGATPADDARLLAELLSSEKDQAELAMIVDLLRNDLGKVAQVGSVEVGPFPEHASFAQVHHLFATIRARRRPEVSLVDLLRAAFPCGSITGAPKLRAMEIIEDLELVRRGVYTGAIGWIGPGPAMHLNVAIRTMSLRDGRVRFNTGGGITADSVPAHEYDETLHKAMGMVRALGADLHIPESRT